MQRRSGRWSGLRSALSAGCSSLSVRGWRGLPCCRERRGQSREYHRTSSAPAGGTATQRRRGAGQRSERAAATARHGDVPAHAASRVAAKRRSSRVNALRATAATQSLPASRQGTSRSICAHWRRWATSRRDAPRSQIADEFRVIKRPLLANVRDKSAAPVRARQPDHGHQFAAGRGQDLRRRQSGDDMAMELDTTVLLVDADVSRPSVLSAGHSRRSRACSTC